MSRLYFNGVSKISFNGRLLSFVIDDTYQKGLTETSKSEVVELISELEAVEGVCRYLLGEIEKIKIISVHEEHIAPEAEDQKLSQEKGELKLGPRLAQVRFDHG